MARPAIDDLDVNAALALARHGLTRKQIAAALRLHRNTISHYVTPQALRRVKGWMPPPLEEVQREIRLRRAAYGAEKLSEIP